VSTQGCALLLLDFQRECERDIHTVVLAGLADRHATVMSVNEVASKWHRSISVSPDNVVQ
jgi:hypothetical protein